MACSRANLTFLTYPIYYGPTLSWRVLGFRRFWFNPRLHTLPKHSHDWTLAYTVASLPNPYPSPYREYRTTPQVASAVLWPRKLGVKPRPIHVGFVVEKNIIPPSLDTHISFVYHQWYMISAIQRVHKLSTSHPLRPFPVCLLYNVGVILQNTSCTSWDWLYNRCWEYLENMREYWHC